MMCPNCDKTMRVTAEQVRARCVVRRRECRHCKTAHETREVFDDWLLPRVQRLQQIEAVVKEINPVIQAMRQDIAEQLT